MTSDLRHWFDRADRRPLVLRGARQVGKTWLVRDLAEHADRELVELNFERNPEHARLFGSSDPAATLADLSLGLDREVSPRRSLLFLDEIQAAGDVLAKLRWFYEELPELPLVAAGSLLEFTLADHSFSMPVGRVSFRRIEPVSFAEFLIAHDQERLWEALGSWRPECDLSPTVHERALEWFDRYAMVGGMPAIVAADVAGARPSELRALQSELMTAYRADFAKYSGRMDRNILDSALAAVAGSIGKKFVYARAAEGVKQQQIKRALELLEAAQLITIVRYTAARTVPIAAEAKDTFRKAVLLDAGLLHALLGTPAADRFPPRDSLGSNVRARLDEQLVAQQLRLFSDLHREPALFYWQRGGGRPGEIDHVIQCQLRIVPIEIKSGTAGSMKSLHHYIHEKELGVAVRVDRNPPSLLPVDVRTTKGDRVQYRLLSLPTYLVARAEQLLESVE